MQREEVVNAVTHGLGLVLSAIAGMALVILVIGNGDAWQVASTLVYTSALIALFAASTCYHAARHPVRKTRLRMLDHCAIYLLIAGSYTPFTLVSLKGPWGWTLFALIWLMAAVGIVYKIFWMGRFPRLSLVFYLAMGWLAIVAIGPLVQRLDFATLMWMLGGGLAYTVGTIFYGTRRLAYAHGIWHIFVLVGSACHFIAIAGLVLAP
jgi:hemolysin III